MKILKTRKVRTPDRGTSKSAGLDFYLPEDFGPLTLFPGESTVIPSGIYAKIPEGYMLEIKDKSGVCSRTGLMIGAKVIDEDYQGEIKIHLINAGRNIVRLNDDPVGFGLAGYEEVTKGKAIAQGILIPVNYTSVQLVDSIHENKTERGAGGFGSTEGKGVAV